MSEAGELGFEPGDQPAQANHNSTQLGGRHDTQIDTGEAVEGLFNGYQHRMGHASKVANSNVCSQPLTKDFSKISIACLAERIDRKCSHQTTRIDPSCVWWHVADASDTGQGIGTFDPGVASQAGGTYDS